MSPLFEEEEDCPLCMEEMDPSDRNFKPCPCGYQICRFCWHRLREEQEKGKCPACRRPYTEEAVQFTPVPQEELDKLKQRKRASKEKCDNLAAIIADRQHLSELRVIQRNLVYVIGVSMKIAEERILREPQYFGQFGKITKIVVNKKAYGHGANSSASAYITYTNDEDAKRAMDAVDGSVFDGRVLRATYGTTKYCSFFLRGLQCSNSECLYLHELGDQVHSFTKDQMACTKQHLQSFIIDNRDSQQFKKFGVLLPPPDLNKPKSPPPPGLDVRPAVSLAPSFELFLDRWKRIADGICGTAQGRWISEFVRSLTLPISSSCRCQTHPSYIDEPFYTRDLLLVPVKEVAPPQTPASKPKPETVKITPKKYDIQPMPSITTLLSQQASVTPTRKSDTSSAPKPPIQPPATSVVVETVRRVPPSPLPVPPAIKNKNIFNLLENEELADIDEGEAVAQIPEKSDARLFKMTVVKKPGSLEEADRLVKDMERRSEKSRETARSLEDQVKTSLSALSLNN